jgi:hypothetical protein
MNPDHSNLNPYPAIQNLHPRRKTLYSPKKRCRLRSPVCFTKKEYIAEVFAEVDGTERTEANRTGDINIVRLSYNDNEDVDDKFDNEDRDDQFDIVRMSYMDDDDEDVNDIDMNGDKDGDLVDDEDDKDDDDIGTFDFNDEDGFEGVSALDEKHSLCTKKDISNKLAEMGLLKYLIELQGSKQQAAMAVITNLANYLMWQRVQSADPWIQDDLNSQVETMLFNLVKGGYNNLQDYVHYLSSIRFLKPTSIMASLNHIKAACQWFVLFRKSNFHLESSDINALTIVVKAINRGQHKQVSNSSAISWKLNHVVVLFQKRRDNSDRSMEQLVHNRHLPEGNLACQLKFLQDTVHRLLPWARQFNSASTVDGITYKKFLGLLGSSLYMFSPQGRVQGIEDVRVSQLTQLLDEGFAQTSKFKTSEKWGYQPVTTSWVRRR